MKRVVFNSRKSGYEIHRFSFLVGRLVWQDNGIRGGYWWSLFPDNGSTYESPDAAMRAYNASRVIPKPTPHYRTVKRFW